VTGGRVLGGAVVVVVVVVVSVVVDSAVVVEAVLVDDTAASLLAVAADPHAVTISANEQATIVERRRRIREFVISWLPLREGLYRAVAGGLSWAVMPPST
jgi:hypothetical protein